MNENDNKRVELKNSVMDKISCDNVCPRSRWVFRSREAGVWALWIATILLGSLSVAVSVFVLQHHQYAIYEATHENFFTFAIEALPYLWLIVFGAMIVFGMYNLRHTKRGYRYPMWQITLSSMLFSLVGGALLNVFGFGYVVDHELGERLTMYQSQEKYEKALWQNPAEGRLVGKKVFETVDSSDVVFEDVQGGRWVLNTEDLNPKDIDMLDAGEMLRVVGVQTDFEVKKFHSCATLPWMMKPETPGQEFKEVKREFKERMRIIAAGQLKKQSSSSEDIAEKVCAKIAAVRRMKEIEE